MKTRNVCFLVSLVVLFASISQVSAQTRPPAAPSNVRFVKGPAEPTTPASTTLTNFQIVKMVKSGLGEAVVIGTIENTTTKSFDLTPDGLIGLKSAGVSDQIILAMQGKSTSPMHAEAIEKPKAAPVVVHQEGIYAMIAGQQQMLNATTISSKGVGGKSMLLGSFGKSMKEKAVILGSHAQLRLSGQPEFYFSSFDPHEYVLVKLESKKDKREIQTGSAGIRGVKNGFEEDDIVSVKISKLESGLYKVTPTTTLTEGEYAFTNASNDLSKKLWDFGVDR